jgi:hypothetical protein
MPSSSARCSQLPRAVDKLPFYVALKKLRDHLRGQLPQLDDSEVVFRDVELKTELKREPASSVNDEDNETRRKNNRKRLTNGRCVDGRGETDAGAGSSEEICPTPALEIDVSRARIDAAAERGRDAATDSNWEIAGCGDCYALTGATCYTALRTCACSNAPAFSSAYPATVASPLGCDGCSANFDPASGNRTQSASGAIAVDVVKPETVRDWLQYGNWMPP